MRLSLNPSSPLSHAAAASSALKDSRLCCSQAQHTGCQMTALRDGASEIDGGMQSQHGGRELISVEEKGGQSQREREGEEKKQRVQVESAGRALCQQERRQREQRG